MRKSQSGRGHSHAPSCRRRSRKVTLQVRFRGHLRRRTKNLRIGSSGGRRAGMSPHPRMSHLDSSSLRKSLCLNCHDFVQRTRGTGKTSKIIRGTCRIRRTGLLRRRWARTRCPGSAQSQLRRGNTPIVSTPYSTVSRPTSPNPSPSSPKFQYFRLQRCYLRRLRLQKCYLSLQKCYPRLQRCYFRLQKCYLRLQKCYLSLQRCFLRRQKCYLRRFRIEKFYLSRLFLQRCYHQGQNQGLLCLFQHHG